MAEGNNQTAQNPLDAAYARMKDVRTLLGRAGYDIGRARIACEGINGTEAFVASLNEVGSKIAYMLGDCISFCDNQQNRIDEERTAKIAEIQRKAKEDEAKRLADAKRKSEVEDAKKMAVVEDAPKTGTPTIAKRGRPKAK